MLTAGNGLGRAEQAARSAKRSEDQAKESARLAHKQAADLQEQHASDFAAAGDPAGAARAHARADQEREKEDHT
jgi:hypothetical protein